MRAPAPPVVQKKKVIQEFQVKGQNKQIHATGYGRATDEEEFYELDEPEISDKGGFVRMKSLNIHGANDFSGVGGAHIMTKHVPFAARQALKRK